MKKLFLLLLTVCTSLTLLADDYKLINFEQLPSNAQKLINTHMTNNGVSVVRVSDTWINANKEYVVLFVDGLEIEFDHNGNWKEVDCERSAVPFSLLPSKITDYIKTKFQKEKVSNIEKDRRGYKIDFNSDLEMYFSLDGDLLEMDWD